MESKVKAIEKDIESCTKTYFEEMPKGTTPEEAAKLLTN